MGHVLVTGAAGFIGSSVVDRLLSRGDAVVGVDNFDPLLYSRAAKEQNLPTHERFEFIEGDILDPQLWERALRDVDRIVHLAALAGVRPSIAHPARYMRVNVEGTVTLLEAARRASIHHVVAASSSSVYGARSKVPFLETDHCEQPESPYAASKRAMEIVSANFHQLYRMSITCLRYFTVYGPRQRPEMAVHRFVRLAREKKPLPVFGDGSAGRDYTFIEDIVDGTIAALDRSPVEPAFRIYNLGGSSPVPLRELIAAIGKATGAEIRTVSEPWQAGDVPITCADISRATRDLGYRPRVSLHDGLRRFVAWFDEQPRRS